MAREATFEEKQRVAMLDASRSAWGEGHTINGLYIVAPTREQAEKEAAEIAAAYRAHRSSFPPTWAQPAERRLYEIEQAFEQARATQRALLDHAKQGQLAPPDEGPDPLGR